MIKFNINLRLLGLCVFYWRQVQTAVRRLRESGP